METEQGVFPLPLFQYYCDKVGMAIHCSEPQDTDIPFLAVSREMIRSLNTWPILVARGLTMNEMWLLKQEKLGITVIKMSEGAWEQLSTLPQGDTMTFQQKVQEKSRFFHLQERFKKSNLFASSWQQGEWSFREFHSLESWVYMGSSDNMEWSSVSLCVMVWPQLLCSILCVHKDKTEVH